MSSHHPSEWVTRFKHLAPRGETVLDLACGSGRHTALFAAAGYSVLALDRDLSKLGPTARLTNVDPVLFDLESGEPWPFSEASFGAIVVTNYLHRPLFPQLIASLQKSGVLLYETFAVGNEEFGKPSNPCFLLKPGELLGAVAGQLSVVAYEHGVVHKPRDAMIQRICAVKTLRPVGLNAPE